MVPEISDTATAVIMESAFHKGLPALSEYDAKKVLKDYGIPVTREVLAENPDDAVSAASGIGYPVVLKACSSHLMHKSDSGLVALGLNGEDAVRDAFERIYAGADAKIDGVLVQEMVAGKRELVVGMIRDSQFGPCVMLGLGGIMTEVFRDAVFRMAPLDAVDAADMTNQLRSRKMLDAFRGEAPADLDSLYGILSAVGRLAMERDEIREIDINPLIVSPDGRVAAVDALIVLEGVADD
ncbi:MAG: acetate--CoA ligase family protein [Thermodesulfobacteriota bacterium]|nr:acetate--CoA ligase family protein [Thermodesulfobacteriota bacterium]